MRVIAGTAGGRRLESVPGDSTRPITDKAKEALFSILHHEIPGARVLDVFAGTGSVGIEALSRGADHCRFLERAPAAIGTIHTNLDLCGLSDRATVLRTDSFKHLRKPPDAPFHFIFVAPPQYRKLWLKALQRLDSVPEWLDRHGVIVVQIDPNEERPVNMVHFEEVDRRTYGSVRLLFYAPRPGEDRDGDVGPGAAPDRGPERRKEQRATRDDAVPDPGTEWDRRGTSNDDVRRGRALAAIGSGPRGRAESGA